MLGILHSICIAPERGQLKKEVESANVIADFGIENDGHAGDWGRCFLPSFKSTGISSSVTTWPFLKAGPLYCPGMITVISWHKTLPTASSTGITCIFVHSLS